MVKQRSSPRKHTLIEGLHLVCSPTTDAKSSNWKQASRRSVLKCTAACAVSGNLHGRRHLQLDQLPCWTECSTGGKRAPFWRRALRTSGAGVGPRSCPGEVALKVPPTDDGRTGCAVQGYAKPTHASCS